MPYDYQTEKPKLFTDEGQRLFLKIRDKVKRLLGAAGAFRLGNAMQNISGDGWTIIACVDRLVELDEIRELHRSVSVDGQDRVFIEHR